MALYFINLFNNNLFCKTRPILTSGLIKSRPRPRPRSGYFDDLVSVFYWSGSGGFGELTSDLANDHQRFFSEPKQQPASPKETVKSLQSVPRTKVIQH